MKIKEYDEQQDLFVIENETTGAEFTADAGTVANLLNMYDEPHTFIGMSFSVSYQVQA